MCQISEMSKALVHLHASVGARGPLKEGAVEHSTREFLAWKRFVKASVINEIRRLWLAVCVLQRRAIKTIGKDESERVSPGKKMLVS